MAEPYERSLKSRDRDHPSFWCRKQSLRNSVELVIPGICLRQIVLEMDRGGLQSAERDIKDIIALLVMICVGSFS
jgi:hypothetical protein